MMQHNSLRSNLVDLVQTNNEDHTAIIFRHSSNSESVSASYEEITTFSEKVVIILKQNNVPLSSFIGLNLNPSISFIPLVLGILKYGAAFTCIDAEEKNEDWNENLYKKLKVAWIFEEADINSPNSKSISFCGDFIQLTPLIPPCNNTEKIGTKDMEPNKFAFACQTSGSTGIPKIIKIPHSSIIPNIIYLRSKFSISENDVVFQAAPPTFDPSVVEIFLALASGATLLMLPGSVKSSPLQLSHALSLQPQPTIIQATPSLIASLGLEKIQTVLLGKNSALRVLALGGEPCPDRSILNLWKSPGNKTEIFNLYGITEVSCWSTCHHVDFIGKFEFDDDKIPLGEAFPETELQVRNAQGCTLTCGEGELFISNGNNTCHVEGDLENFSQCRWRATGDLVKIYSNGSLYFVSRKSETRIIKRWGHKVSLAAIEKASNKCPVVQASFALSNVTDSLQLVLCVALCAIDSSEVLIVKKHLRTCLSSTSLPDAIIPLAEVPLTKHGKINKRILIDKAVLWEKVNFNKIPAYCDPQMVEHFVKQMWMEALGITEEWKVDDKDSFLAGGGDSVSAALLCADLLRWAGKSHQQQLLTTILEGTLMEVSTCLLNLIKDPPDIVPKKMRLDTSNSMTTIEISESNNVDLLLVQKINENRCKSIPVVDITTNYNHVWQEAVTEMDHPSLVRALSRGNTVSLLPVDLTACSLGIVSELKIHWSREMKKCVDASPLVLEFKNKTCLAIIGSHSGRVICVNIDSGIENWKLELDERIESSAIASTCGKFVFIGCYDGRMYCIQVETGTVCWAFQTGAMIKGSAIIYETSVIFGSYDQSVYSLNIKDGSLIWQRDLNSGALLASPCLTEELVFVSTLGGLRAAICAKSGVLRWSAAGSKPYFASPALIHSNRVVFGTVDGTVTCVEVADGAVIWCFQAKGNIFSSFAIGEDSVSTDCHIYFGCSDSGVYCLNSKGKHLWTTQLGGRVTSTPFLFHYPVEKSYKQNLLVICRAPNHIVVINAASGTILFEQTLPQETFSSPVVIANFIILGCRDDNFYCFTLQTAD